MTVYYFCLIFLFIFTILEVAGAKQIKILGKTSINSIAFIYIAIFLIILTSMRFQVGKDYTSYLYIYNTIESKMKNRDIEFGYVLLNYIFSPIPNGFYWMQFCTMIFCTVSVYSSLYKRSDFPIFSLCLYFCLYFFPLGFCQTRQYIAIAILCIGNRFIEKKKLIRWTLIVVLAMQFHVTAIIAFPLYFTGNIKNLNPFLAFITLFCILILNLFGLNLIWKMIDIILVMPFVPKRITTILNIYIHSKKYGLQIEYAMGGLVLVGNYFFAFIVILLYALDIRNIRIAQKITREQNIQHQNILHKHSIQISNLLVAFIFQSMGRNFDQLGRLTYYYFICGGGLLAYNYLASTRLFSKKHFKFLNVFLCAILIFLRIYRMSGAFEQVVYTYHFLPFQLNNL